MSATLKVLRERVANEPHDSRGELARALLEEIDRILADQEAKDRSQSIDRMIREHHLTEAEANKVYDSWATIGFAMEEGPCRHCNASGEVMDSSHCFGYKYKDCPRCHGTKIDKHRIKVPG